MPTGYTSDLYYGKSIDFPTFALRCARAMGACIMQRDDPMDVLPTLQTATSYHTDRMAAAEARLAELRDVDHAEADRLAEADFAAEYDRWDATERETAARRTRYEAMLAAVRAWTPPTPEHAGLQVFMIEQLRDSIEFDCNIRRDPPVRKDGATWLADERERAQRDLAYHATRHAEEQERVASRNAWITALYTALDAPPVEIANG